MVGLTRPNSCKERTHFLRTSVGQLQLPQLPQSSSTTRAVVEKAPYLLGSDKCPHDKRHHAVQNVRDETGRLIKPFYISQYKY